MYIDKTKINLIKFLQKKQQQSYIQYLFIHILNFAIRNFTFTVHLLQPDNGEATKNLIERSRKSANRSGDARLDAAQVHANKISRTCRNIAQRRQPTFLIQKSILLWRYFSLYQII